MVKNNGKSFNYINTAHTKEWVCKLIYNLYIDGVDIHSMSINLRIRYDLNLSFDEINEVIDCINEIL